MGFTPLVDGAGVPSPQAVLERMTGVAIVYNGSEDTMNALLDACGGGLVKIFSQDPTTLPTDYAVTFCGGVYQVWLSGTVSGDQLLAQINGGLWTQNVPVLGTVNSFWLEVAQHVSADIARTIAEGISGASGLPVSVGAYDISTPSPARVPGLVVEFIGDSYGAGVAAILAVAYAGVYGAGNVSLCAFGAPKVFVSGYAGPVPGVWIRPHRNGDPVPYLPATVGFRMTDVSSPVGGDSVGRRVVWQHYGSGWLIQDTGLLVTDPYDTRESWLSLAVFLAMSVDQHRYNNVARYLANLAFVPGALNAQGLAVLVVLDRVVDLPQHGGFMTAPVPTAETATNANAVNFGTTAGPLTPGTLRAAQQSFLTGATVNWLSPATANGGDSMALQIRPPVDNAYLRVTFFLRAGGITASESHIINNQTANVDIRKLQALGLLQKRMAMAPTGVSALRYRIGVVGRPRIARSYDASSAKAVLPGSINLSGDSIVASMTIVQASTVPPIGTEARVFCAFPTDLSMVGGSYYAPNGVANDQAYDTALTEYAAELIAPNASPSDPWGVLALNRSNNVCPTMNVVRIEYAAGSDIVTVNVMLDATQACNLTAGDVVRLSRIPNPTQLLPWNQNWYVFLGANLVAGPGSFQIKLPAPAVATGHTQPGGFAHKQLETFFAYSAQGPIFGTDRRRGVRVFQPLGRRKIKRTVGY